MSIQSEIERIKANVAAAYTEVSGKGGTVPAAKTSANLASAIGTIPTGVELTPVSLTVINSVSSSITIIWSDGTDLHADTIPSKASVTIDTIQNGVLIAGGTIPTSQQGGRGLALDPAVSSFPTPNLFCGKTATTTSGVVYSIFTVTAGGAFGIKIGIVSNRIDT